MAIQQVQAQSPICRSTLIPYDLYTSDLSTDHYNNSNFGSAAGYGQTYAQVNLGGYNAAYVQPIWPAQSIRQAPAALAPAALPIEVAFGGYNVPHEPMQRIQYAQQPPAAPVAPFVPVSVAAAPVPAPVTANVIDLTKDTSVNEARAKTPPTPAPKPSSTYWKRGERCLIRYLSSESRSDSFRLFKSMENYWNPTKRHHYCERHWPTEDNAIKDVNEKSKWFIDAEELFTYDLKWHRLSELSMLESPSENEKEKKKELEAEITKEKTALEGKLSEKRMLNMEKEEHAQWSNRVENMKRTAFKDAFGIPMTDANVRLVCSKKEASLRNEGTGDQPSAEKRTADEPSSAGDRPAKRRNTGGRRTSDQQVALTSIPSPPEEQPDRDSDAQGETDEEDGLEAAAMGALRSIWQQDEAQDQPAVLLPTRPAGRADEGYIAFLVPLSFPNSKAPETPESMVEEEKDDDLHSLFSDNGCN